MVSSTLLNNINNGTYLSKVEKIGDLEVAKMIQVIEIRKEDVIMEDVMQPGTTYEMSFAEVMNWTPVSRS